MELSYIMNSYRFVCMCVFSFHTDYFIISEVNQRRDTGACLVIGRYMTGDGHCILCALYINFIMYNAIVSLSLSQAMSVLIMVNNVSANYFHVHHVLSSH